MCRFHEFLLMLGLSGVVTVDGWSQPASALPGAHSKPQYVHRHWDRTDGLPQNTVAAIAQTKDGYLWFATEEGLARFDGMRFVVFNTVTAPQLPAPGILTLLADQVGGLWIGTAGGGLALLHGSTIRVFGTAQGLPNQVITALFEDRERTLWVGTEGGGLSRWNGTTFETFTTRNGLVNDVVTAIAQEASGALWIGTHSGVSRWHQGQFQTFSATHGLPSKDVRAMHGDKHGRMWICTTQGLARYEGGEITVIPSKDGTPDFVRSIIEDRAGVIWLGTLEGGLKRVEEGKIVHFELVEGPEPNDIRALLEDAEGSLWIGTNADGLHRSTQARVATYGKREGLSHEVALATMEDSAGTIWVATYGGGLNRFRDGSWTSLTQGDGLSSDIVLSLAQGRAGDLWIGTRVGVDRLRGERVESLNAKWGLAPEPVLSLLEDRRGDLWIGTRSGVKRVTADQVRGYGSSDGLRSEVVLAIFESGDGTIWVGTEGGGVAFFKEDRFVKGAELRGEIVMSISEDAEGALWLGTNAGVERLRKERLTTYAKLDHHEMAVIFRILDDEAGNFWMSCNRGILRVRKTDFDRFDSGELTQIPTSSFDESDGMRSAEANGGIQPAGWRSRDGKLWFPTLRGVVMIDPKTVSLGVRAPPVIIEEVLFNREGVEPKKMLTGRPGVRSLEFRYTAPTFISPHTVKFRHRLEGYESEWIDAGSRRAAYYTNIRPGEYKFQVIACGSDGVWPDSGAEMPFRLLPYFTQTRTFYGLCVAVVALLILGLHRRHVKTVERRGLAMASLAEERGRANEELDRRVRERTAELEAANRALESFSYSVSHDLRAPLRAVDGYAKMLEDDYGEQLDSEGRRMLGTLRSEAHRMAALIGDLLQFAQMGRREMSSARVDMNALVRSVSEEIKKQWPTRTIEIEVEPLPCAVGDRAMLRQVWMNLLNNAAKFTGARPDALIKVGAKAATDQIDPDAKRRGNSSDSSSDSSRCKSTVYYVQDNGVGFDMKYSNKLFRVFQRLHSQSEFEGTGVGLALIQQIVQRHGGSVWAEGKPGAGATFYFQLPERTVLSDAAAASLKTDF